MTKERHIILAPMGLGLIVLAGAFLLSSVLSTYNTYAAPYTLTLSSSGSQSIDVSNMGDKTAISADNLNVATNCRYGYNLTLSTSVNNNNLYLNGNSSNNTTGTYFSPVNGTSTLKNSSNTWGYYYNSSTPTTAPTSSSIFSPVPTLSTPAIIKTPLTTPSSSDINDNFNIYYGVASSDSMPVGTYKLIPDTNNSGNDGTLVYNATIADSCIPYVIHFNPTSTSTGSTLSGTGTMNDQEVYKDTATTLTTNGFIPPNGYEFKEWNTAQDGSGTKYANEASITNLTLPGNTITLYAIWRIPPAPLYDKVASLVKTDSDSNPRTQSVADLRTAITEPTSSDPAADTSNSGVFLYDPTIFGVASDASNDYPIYYYRGILDSDLDGTSSTYGSNGNGEYYPNYIKLNSNSIETCWRIVRTTGSGGTKMIYNGIYGATTAGSCANSLWNTTLGARASRFQAVSSTGGQAGYVVYAGYTYNSNYLGTGSALYSELFGTNSNFSGNSTNSSIKNDLENYANTDLNEYLDILEPSAGYCNDRSAYDTSSASATPISDGDTKGYSTNMYFGGDIRNYVSNGVLSLSCPRNIVDLYTANTANDGNKQMRYPIALLTADEAALAGSGYGSTSNTRYSSFYNSNSYLRSGSGFFTLNASRRYNYVYIMIVQSGGQIGSAALYSTYEAGSRPVISLNHDTMIYGGSGTAMNPWTIDED